MFRQFSEVRANLHVVSNTLIFDEAGIAVSHSHPLVHSYNKGKSPEQLAAVEPFIVVGKATAESAIPAVYCVLSVAMSIYAE